MMMEKRKRKNLQTFCLKKRQTMRKEESERKGSFKGEVNVTHQWRSVCAVLYESYLRDFCGRGGCGSAFRPTLELLCIKPIASTIPLLDFVFALLWI
jgi:hypothetical protein